jgi:hypothetical protein
MGEEGGREIKLSVEKNFEKIGNGDASSVHTRKTTINLLHPVKRIIYQLHSSKNF